MKPVGESVSELRIDYGPGYRVYFTQRGRQMVILLAGGEMTFSFHPEAESEFREAIDYCKNCERGLGYDFSTELFGNNIP